MSTQLLTTKLVVPPARPQLVARPWLIERLRAGSAGKLTLISAPAGFGKTTLLTAWLAEMQRAAWLALDPADNDPTRFWIYVAAALDRASPGCAAATLVALEALHSPAIEVVLTDLLNAVAALPAPLILVLDDYHVIEAPAIHQGLTFLIDHLPPTLRLVIATRVDPLLPLARLRARGELTELRIADLRFTAEESAAFLRAMVGLDLAPEHVAALEQRTEGWAAGLQLAALAMRGRPDRSGFIAGFTGSSRFVVDYLAAEVLDHLPRHLHSFVLQTAILDRLCASLCDAVLGVDAAIQPAGNGQISVLDRQQPPGASGYSRLLLAELERLNLFLIPLDDERVWYRYHHLFAEVLRERLRAGASAAAVAELHRRASVWYEQQAEVEGQPFVADAVQHALAGRDWERAARLIEVHGLPLALRGNVATVLGWLNALPEALFQTRPALSMNHAVLLMFINRVADCEARLRDVEHSLPPEADDDERTRTTRGQLVLMRANLARAYGDLAACVALSRQALAILPPSAAIPRAGSVLNLGRAYQITGDVSPAAEGLAEEAVQRQRAAGNEVALLNAITNLAWLRVLQGRLRAAAATYEEGRRATPSGPQGLGAPAYYFGVGAISYARNDLAAAEAALTQGLELLEHGTMITDATIAAQGYLAGALLRQAQSDHAGALQVLQGLSRAAPSGRRVPLIEAWGEAMRARLLLAHGDLDGALGWAEAVAPAALEEAPFLHELALLTLARIWIAQSRREASSRRAVEAGALLDRLLADALAAGRGASVLEIRVLQALALQARGSDQAALEALAPVLPLAAEEGHIRVFVDAGAAMAALVAMLPPGSWRDAVLRAFAGTEAPTGSPLTPREAAADLSEPLTAREREVLLLIAEGASNGEIAERLVIAVGTVKRHINSLFGKLQVESRTQALRVARMRGLL